MNQDERTVIDGIFERMRAAANQPRDPEAEKYIAQHIQAQPYAPYAMAQSVYVQEQALVNQQQQIEQLQAQVQRLEAQIQQAPPQQAAPQQGGFLSGIFGGGAASQPQREPPAYGQQRGREPQGGASPWANQPQAAPQGGSPWSQAGAAPQQRQGMGFLGTAAAAAAGVAGGMMVGNLLSSAFGGGTAKAATPETPGLDSKSSQGQNSAPQDEEEEDYGDEAGYDEGDYGSDTDSYEA